jgi:hypothetical protein
MEVLQQNHAIMRRVLGMSVPQRTDKSGRLHPRKSVTIAYIDAQAEDQITYYREYRRYVLFRFCLYSSVFARTDYTQGESSSRRD